MNFYNPYFYTSPFTNSATNLARPGILRSLFQRGVGNFSLANILNGAQRTLNVANQSINLVRQVHPMVKNAKTMFKVIKTESNNIRESVNEVKQTTNGPTFFQ